MNLFKPTTILYYFSCIIFLSCDLFVTESSTKDSSQTPSSIPITNDEINNALNDLILSNTNFLPPEENNGLSLTNTNFLPPEENNGLSLTNTNSPPPEENSNTEISFSQNSYTVNIAYDVTQDYSNFPLTSEIVAFPLQETFHYSLVQESSSQLFYIDPNLGLLTIRTLESSDAFLTVQPCSTYNFNVRATDSNQNTVTATIPVTVSFSTDPNWSDDTTCDNDDHSPTFVSPTLTIPISSDTIQHSSSSFYSVYAEDQDQGDTLQYSLSGTDSDQFIINPDTAILSYTTSSNLTDGATFSLVVTVEDTEENIATQQVTVQVNSPYEPTLDVYVVRGGREKYRYDCNGNIPCTTENDIRDYIEDALIEISTYYDRINFVNPNIIFVKHPTTYTPHSSQTMLDLLLNYNGSVVTYQTGYMFTPTDVDGTPTGAAPFRINYSSSKIPIILTKGLHIADTTSTSIVCAYVTYNTNSEGHFSVDSAYHGGALIVLGSNPICDIVRDMAHEFGHFLSLPHSFNSRSCQTKREGSTNRIMDYSVTQVTFATCEEEIITSFIYSFFFVKTQYERQRLNYSRNLQTQQLRTRFSIPRIFNPGRISTSYISVLKDANDSSKKNYIEYTKTKQQTCYNLFANYDYCY